MRHKTRCTIAMIMALLLAASVSAGPASAAISISSTFQSSLDKTLAAADGTMSSKISSQYKDFASLQQEDARWDASIKAIHYQNEEAESLLRKQIKLIDAAKIDKLELQVKQTRERNKKLLDLYASLNRQIAASRSIGTKEMTSMLRSQAEALKPAVQLARQDIRNKEDALKAAKANAARMMKKIRAALDETDPLVIRIKAERSSTDIPKKSLAAEWKKAGNAVKKRDAAATLASLTTSVSLTRQIIEQKRKIHTLETKIAAVIQQAKSQLPAS
ncbi:hypothetical protein [Paenibacillus spongiae]|uniref:Uncharacterized protein n=1 Tax=Paenibacillus spongiae TaxID=2909671 RepID=A0ABY5SB46_9BACL|nr:hypothetical protein [Paenibacillus spongiae]UVI30755.1 hypothetical protein L1F29_02415 [Paenibacillus spongiae]